jgi:hypothetical protein
MIPGTRVVHATKTELQGVVREYAAEGIDREGKPTPSVLVAWGPGGSKGVSWVPIADIVALEMEEAVADREWFSCFVAGGEAKVRLGELEFVGSVIQAEVHTVAIPEKQCQVQIVLQEPVTRLAEERESMTYEVHAPETVPDVNVRPPTFPLGDPEE